MAFQVSYKTIFQVTVLHSYFLNDGEVAFVTMEAQQQQEQLKAYDVDTYLEIIPSHATQVVMENYKMVFRHTPTGFIVLQQIITDENGDASVIALPEDVAFTFLVYAHDPLFTNYTLLPKEQYQLYLFSNVKPNTESLPFTYIPLKTEETVITQDFLMTAESSRLIWYEMEQENRARDTHYTLDQIAMLDVEALNTAEGVHILNQAIQSAQNKGVLGVIQLQAIGDDMRDLVSIDDTDPDAIKTYLLEPHPHYTLHFDNQKTIWQYHKRSEDITLETVTTKPLTKNGFVVIDPLVDFDPPIPINTHVFPNPTVERIKQVNNEMTNTLVTYSEIYI